MEKSIFSAQQMKLTNPSTREYISTSSARSQKTRRAMSVNRSGSIIETYSSTLILLPDISDGQLNLLVLSLILLGDWYPFCCRKTLLQLGFHNPQFQSDTLQAVIWFQISNVKWCQNITRIRHAFRLSRFLASASNLFKSMPGLSCIKDNHTVDKGLKLW